MNGSTKLGAGFGLMLVGTVAMFAPLANIEVPLPVLGVAVLVLALGTLLVGISGIEEGGYSV